MSDKLHLLFDSSVILPYYMPEATKNANCASRVKVILDSVRKQRTNAICYIPNICAAEVIANMDRQAYSSWDTQINKQYGGPGKTLHTAKYRAARKKFFEDIHNGELFYQYELNRYHILALDLIAPVDKYMKFYRKGNQRSMGAFDLLVGSMALHLKRLHGGERFALLTGDRRMEAIFANACPNLNENTAVKLGMVKQAAELGFKYWSPDLYPRVIDLQRCTETSLVEFFGAWPLRTKWLPGHAPKV
jgi:hypothetical protein